MKAAPLSVVSVTLLIAACRPDDPEATAAADPCVETPFAAYERKVNSEAQTRIDELTRDYLAACNDIASELEVVVKDPSTIDGCVTALSPAISANFAYNSYVAAPPQQCDVSIQAWRESVEECGAVACDVATVRCATSQNYVPPTEADASFRPFISCPGVCTPATGQTSVSCSRPDACDVACPSDCGAATTCDVAARSCRCAGSCNGTPEAPVTCNGTCSGGTSALCRNSFPAAACTVDARCRSFASVHAIATAVCALRSFDVRSTSGEPFGRGVGIGMETLGRVRWQVSALASAYQSVQVVLNSSGGPYLRAGNCGPQIMYSDLSGRLTNLTSSMSRLYFGALGSL